MQSALRPYATAGVAIVGASLIAAAPPSSGPLPGIQTLHDVALTAGDSAWVDAFNTALPAGDEMIIDDLAEDEEL